MSNKQYPLDKVLICTSAEITLFGWVSSKNAKLKGTPSTADMVKMLMDKSDSKPAKERREELIALAKDKGIDLFDPKYQQEVGDAIEWAKSLPVEKPRDQFAAAVGGEPYNNVISAIARSGFVTARKFGFACSILSSYRRNEERRSQSPSKYIGVEGDTISGVAAVLSVKEVATNWVRKNFEKFQNQDGKSWLVTMKINDNLIKWWASSEPDFTAGAIVNYVGKVKKHEEFNGSKSTVINYAKVEKK